MNEELFQRVVAAAGGLKQMADALGYSAQRVSNWRDGIPAKECKAVEALTGISVRELRPDDWHCYWPEEQAA